MKELLAMGRSRHKFVNQAWPLLLFAVTLTGVQAPSARAQIWISPVDTYPHVNTDLGSSSDYWRQCVNDEHRRPATQAISNCSRLIGDRMDRLETSIALYYRGTAYQDAGDPAHARNDFSRAVEIAGSFVSSHPRSPDGYIYRAYALYELGEYDRALADYDAAIAVDRRRPSPHGGRGAILFRRGDYAGAIAEFDQAQHLLVYGNGEDYSTERCESRAAASAEIDEARRACERGIRESGANSDSLVSRGFLNFLQGQIESSASDFEAALRRDGRNATALYGRGVTSTRLGRREEGQADIDRARGMDGSAVDYYANAGLRP